MIVVSDTSPLSNLAIVEHLWLLRQLYTTVIIPQAVANELASAGDEDQRVTDVLFLDWVEIREVTNLELVAELRQRNLDLGEAEAITLTVELQADELLIDERLGRREATQLGLPIVGILGVLLVAKQRGLIPAVQPVMNALISEAGFRVSSQLYTDILSAAGE
ncbi:DUF3368 domain-containing protein [Kovacikia minuta CCNUW1]|uniref:DUF3368 domain-containing protein n=1 Tax=Kovacikia minuta TaxID=2931930 RepID=UPI001CCED84E|nr:DUF3368 domain-containing protein [Kovacikia minuta]UBF29258.1 DUF3368 domain-containing protein [Kovacikia minuta CCNUW1]